VRTKRATASPRNGWLALPNRRRNAPIRRGHDAVAHGGHRDHREGDAADPKLADLEVDLRLVRHRREPVERALIERPAE